MFSGIFLSNSQIRKKKAMRNSCANTTIEVAYRGLKKNE